MKKRALRKADVRSRCVRLPCMSFLDELRPLLNEFLAKHRLERDVEGAFEVFVDVYGDVLDTTQGQWGFVEAVLSDLYVHDKIFTTIELDMLLRTLGGPSRSHPVDWEGIDLTVPFDVFPKGAQSLCCETGLVTEVEPDDGGTDYSSAERLIVSYGKSKPGDAGTRGFATVTRTAIARYDNPLEFFEALIAAS